jgi:hypothetical protein
MKFSLDRASSLGFGFADTALSVQVTPYTSAVIHNSLARDPPSTATPPVACLPVIGFRGRCFARPPLSRGETRSLTVLFTIGEKRRLLGRWSSRFVPGARHILPEDRRGRLDILTGGPIAPSPHRSPTMQGRSPLLPHPRLMIDAPFVPWLVLRCLVPSFGRSRGPKPGGDPWVSPEGTTPPDTPVGHFGQPVPPSLFSLVFLRITDEAERGTRTLILSLEG